MWKYLFTKIIKSCQAAKNLLQEMWIFILLTGPMLIKF